MTNTLHRFGTADSFADDYVIIAIPTKGATTSDPMPALKRFLEIALEYGPVNLGDAMNGGAIRPTRHKWALEHFGTRPTKPDFQAVIDGITKPTTYAAVFDDKEKAEAFVARIRDGALPTTTGSCSTTPVKFSAEACLVGRLPARWISIVPLLRFFLRLGKA